MCPPEKGVLMQSISLSGPWALRLNPDRDRHVVDPPDDVIDGTMYLPGSTDEYGYGTTVDDRPRDHLQRTHRYEGSAWYQRTVSVPDSWAGKRVTLTLERTRPTEVWVDGERIGSRVCLSTPHVYDLTEAIGPGEHEIAVRVDNADDSMDRPGVRRSHASTEHTQTNWNGIIGDLRLEATPNVWIESVDPFPEPSENAVDLEITLGNATETDFQGTVSAAARSTTTDEIHVADTVDRPVSVSAGDGSAPGRTTLEFTYDLGSDALTWDEFSPAVYELTVSLETAGDENAAGHEFETAFGLREFEADGTQFSINGTTIFLRGRTDCCVFPDTAYPPTTVAEWVDHMETARAYGINHYRFHSWCPPEAAFEAADRVGMYLQPECSQWNNGTSLADADDYEYYEREAERILDAYGHHPSFVCFTLGNENRGDEERMTELVRHCRALDDRRLYAYGANNFLTSPHPGDADDFFVTANVPEDAEASHWDVDRTPIRGTGHVNDSPPSTAVDYEDELEPYDLPVVGHEIGQYQVHPDYDETRKYRGVLRARNLERFERSLADRYLEGSDADFRAASGALAVTCYREEIEAAFRTAGFGGFQLLGLDDFPGQGTAMVGILDSFMESKGLIEPHEWRRFCSARVPLLSFDRYTFTTDDAFEAESLLANYGPGPIADATATWSIAELDGTETASGALERDVLEQGELTSLGTIDAPLEDVDAPARFEVTLAVEGADLEDGSAVDLRTTYPIWVYPETPEIAANTDDIDVSWRFDERTRTRLEDGETVLLLPEPSALRYGLEGSFQPDFWNYEIFKQNGKPGTLGMTTDPDHPLFDAFPTEDYADWQWWPLLRHSRPIVLDDAPADFEPTVQIIDTIYRNHKLGVYFETAVGDGALAVCTLDLSGDAPAVRQFRHSLESYLASEAFDPDSALSTGVLDSLLNAGRDDERDYGDDAGAWVERN
ncbi:glycoside hydrolase family 2 sugar binding protein (plasmid) [Haloterrigena turkmenica DSM 5511]|uniref:Glycoside hydrolase family 2 sugar binding protein n=2 Tax=Haloterrigena turkmenica TaxID=62320 RepID=D2S057_HALTV|nr:glycoside hydrolase family 2 sugar binding protein [Haloterrigena turkmenica DSM 5511]